MSLNTAKYNQLYLLMQNTIKSGNLPPFRKLYSLYTSFRSGIYFVSYILTPVGLSRQLKELNIVKYGESLVQNRM